MNFGKTEAERYTGRSLLVVAFWLAMGPAVSLGFGRFGYALVLPAMKSDLALTYAQAGALNSANAAGYLLGALFSASVTRFVPPRRVMLAGLIGSVLALAMAGVAHSFLLLLICRALVGTAGAFTFVAASTLAARLGQNSRENALAVGIVISGAGFGVIMTGLLVPFLVGSSAEHWPRAWAAMALIGTLCTLGITHFSRGMAGVPSSSQEKVVHGRLNIVPLLPTFIAYFLFGLGYIAYMTFLVAYVRSLGVAPLAVALSWAGLGCAMCVSAFFWRNSLARERGGGTLAIMGAGGALSALVLLLFQGLPALLISAVGFGLTAMPIFAAVTVLIRLHLPVQAWTSGIALFTIAFALGQGIGPIGSGYLSDYFGPRASLVWTCSIMTIATLVALFQKTHAEPEEGGAPAT